MPDECSSGDCKSATFRREQRGVALAMGAALGISLLALALAASAGRDLPALDFARRLQLTLQADSLVIVWLAATIANVARLRFFSEQDIGGSGSPGASDPIRRASAVAQNTLEQAVLAIAVHMLIAATFPKSREVMLTMVGLFAAGRLLFWTGYKRGARARALGFGLTFYPSVLGLLASLGTLLLGMAPAG
jgi:uncharacterized membrane protein YecN with MAPEG domain